MGPDHGAVDHVRRPITADQLGQRLQQRVEHTLLDPAAIAAEDAVPLAVAGRKMPPLRPRPRHPYHPVEELTIISGRTATAPRFGRKQRTGQRPFRIRRPDRLVHRHLQMAALNQSRSPASSFVHER